MIHTDDFDIFKRMAGENCVMRSGMRARIEKKYMRILRFCHRAGRTGPLGPSLCAVILDALDFHPPQSNVKVAGDEVDWRRVKLGDRVRVTVGSRELSGKYAGQVTGGSIAVVLDGHDVVQECYPKDCKLWPKAGVSDIDMESMRAIKDDGPDKARLESIADDDQESRMADMLEEVEEELTQPDEAEERVLGDDTASYTTGDTVHLMRDGEIVEAAFLRDGLKKDEIMVWLNDSESAIKRTQVTAVQPQPMEA